MSGARPATPKPGDLVAGRYRLEEQLGEGASALVFRATDEALGRDVAVKVLPQQMSSSPELRQRLDREARTISQLSHPHICTLHDVGHQEIGRAHV